MQGDNKKKKGEESLYFLRDKVYPDLYESLIQVFQNYYIFIFNPI